MAKHFEGIMTPIMTPLDAQRNILFDEMRRHTEFLLDAGVHSFLVPSGTGEFENLTFEQRQELVKVVVDTVKGRVPVVALVNDCSTANVLMLTKMAVEAGADEIMVTPPYYTHIDQRAIAKFYTEIADRSPVPVWLYNQPGETKLTIDPEVVIELAKHPNIVGIKIAAGDDFFYFCRLKQLMRDNSEFSILMGEDYATLASYCMGGDGSVASLSNVIPCEFVDLFNAWKVGNVSKAQELQDRIMDLFDALVMVDTGCYHSACKTALREMGLYSTNLVSSPFVEILPEEEKVVIQKAKALGLF